MREKVFKILLIIVILFTFTGCRIKNEDLMSEKLDSELKYIEDIIFVIANKHAKNEYIVNESFDWNSLKEEGIKINDAFATLVSDVSTTKVENDKIIDCSNNVNNLLISINEEDEESTLNNTLKTYENIISFKESYSDDKNFIEKMKLKNKIFKIYYLCWNKKWDEAMEVGNNLENSYNDLMKDEKYSSENQYNLNKVYILIQEYKRTIEIKNLDLLKIKYITVIGSI